MSRWYASYLCQAAVWVVIAALAFSFKVVAQAPISLMFVIPLIPYAAAASLGFEDGGPVMGFLLWVWQIALAGLVVWYFVLASKQWERGRRALALMLPHAGIVFVGLVATLVVGSINFPFSL